MFFILAVLIVTLIFFILIGGYALFVNPKAAPNRIFIGVIFIFSLWICAAILRNLSSRPEAIMLWRFMSLIAWTFGSCGILFFVLSLTSRKRKFPGLKHTLIFLPGAALFIFQSLILTEVILQTSKQHEFLYEYIGSSIFYLIYISAAVIYLFRWIKKTNRKKEKIQGKLIAYSLMITTLCTFLYGNLLPILVKTILPFMLPVFPVVWIAGMGVAITRYRLMEFQPWAAIFEIMENVMELIILTNENGKIVNVNIQVESKLGLRGSELEGKNIETVIGLNLDKFFSQDDGAGNGQDNGSKVEKEMVLYGNREKYLPVRLMVSRVVDDIGKEVIGYVFSGQDLTLEKKYQMLSITDPLTQVNNRLKLDEIIEYEIQQANRYKNCMCVILLDIDHFKTINDNFGHPAGDTVLVDFAEMLQVTIRETDTIGRWGGEEFLIILPNTGLEPTLKVAEKLRSVIEGHRFSAGMKVTASFGVSAYTGPEDTSSKLLSRADDALYKAKRNGRNRVESFVL